MVTIRSPYTNASVPAGDGEGLFVPPPDLALPFENVAEAIFARLPDCYTEADADLDSPLQRWLSGISGEADDIEALVNRFYFDTPEDGGGTEGTSELADPNVANEEWLPWIAQLTGVKFPEYASTSQKRELLKSNDNQHLSGSDGRIIQIAQTELMGDQRARLVKRHIDLQTTGTVWDMLLVTHKDDTVENLLPRTESSFSSVGSWLLYAGSSRDVLGELTIAEDPDNDTRFISRILTLQARELNEFAFVNGSNIVNPGVAVIAAVRVKPPKDMTASVTIRSYDAAGNTIKASTVTDQPIPANVYTMVQSAAFTDTDKTHYLKVRVEFSSLSSGEEVVLRQANLTTQLDNLSWKPTTSDPLGAIVAAQEKPAGVLMRHLVSDDDGADWYSGA